MGLFSKKKGTTASLEVPASNSNAKSEATTVVPSQNVSDTESLKNSREVETTVLDEKEKLPAQHSITAPTTDNDDSTVVPLESAASVSPETEEREAKAEQNVEIHRTRTQSSSVVAPPGVDDDDIVYPSGMKLVVITLALCLSVFLVALDNTIIATAIPKITDHFNSLGDIGWYASAYLLTTAALQLFFGK